MLRLVAPTACLGSLCAFWGALDTESVRIGRVVGFVNLFLYVFYRKGRLLDFFGCRSHVGAVNTLSLDLGLATFLLCLRFKVGVIIFLFESVGTANSCTNLTHGDSFLHSTALTHLAYYKIYYIFQND